LQEESIVATRASEISIYFFMFFFKKLFDSNPNDKSLLKTVVYCCVTL
jgi:hypothetical protein